MASREKEPGDESGEAYAEPADFPLRWSPGAPVPFVLANEDTVFVTFYVDEPDPHWDGTAAEAVDPGSSDARLLALVAFEGCASFRFGAPNDEVLSGHPLYRKGLEPYSAQIVRNSPWIAELEAINSVHPHYRAASWLDLTHWIFWFHDSTFECVARSYRVETFREPMRALLARVTARLLD